MAPTYNLQHVTMDYPFMTLLVKVNTSSSGQKTVAKVLKDCHGIYSFRMDGDCKVQVSGTIDPDLLLKKLGKAGKKAELLWLQFGECSNNLFMPRNHSGIGGYGGQNYLPSHNALGSSAYNQKYGNQIAYGNKNDYDHHTYDHNYHHQHTYGHNNDHQTVYDHGHNCYGEYQQGYEHGHDYQHAYDHRHDYQRSYGSGYEVNHTQYRTPACGEDMGCCRMM